MKNLDEIPKFEHAKYCQLCYDRVKLSENHFHVSPKSFTPLYEENYHKISKVLCVCSLEKHLNKYWRESTEIDFKYRNLWNKWYCSENTYYDRCFCVLEGPDYCDVSTVHIGNGFFACPECGFIYNMSASFYKMRIDYKGVDAPYPPAKIIPPYNHKLLRNINGEKDDEPYLFKDYFQTEEMNECRYIEDYEYKPGIYDIEFIWLHYECGNYDCREVDVKFEIISANRIGQNSMISEPQEGVIQKKIDD